MISPVNMINDCFSLFLHSDFIFSYVLSKTCAYSSQRSILRICISDKWYTYLISVDSSRSHPQPELSVSAFNHTPLSRNPSPSCLTFQKKSWIVLSTQFLLTTSGSVSGWWAFAGTLLLWKLLGLYSIKAPTLELTHMATKHRPSLCWQNLFAP